jgi:hypothetical protein
VRCWIRGNRRHTWTSGFLRADEGSDRVTNELPDGEPHRVSNEESDSVPDRVPDREPDHVTDHITDRVPD